MKKSKTIGEWTLWVLQYAWEVVLEFLKIGAVILRGAKTKTDADDYTYQDKKDHFDWKD